MGQTTFMSFWIYNESVKYSYWIKTLSLFGKNYLVGELTSLRLVLESNKQTGFHKGLSKCLKVLLVMFMRNHADVLSYSGLVKFIQNCIYIYCETFN